MNKERWEKFSFEEQMGHIGSEYGRAESLNKKGDQENYKVSLERAIELIELTINDKRWETRLYEILKLKDVLVDLYEETRKYNVSAQYLENYFLSLALLIKK